MAWEYITWSCGHEGRKQLYGPHKERESYVEWAEESGLCPDCYREIKEAEREQERAENRAAVPEALPTIDGGTEKQNAYAEDLRAALWSKLEVGVAEMRKDPEYAELTAEGFLLLDAEGPRLFREMFAIRDPRYWIDVVGRDRTLVSVARDPRTTEYLAGRSNAGEGL